MPKILLYGLTVNSRKKYIFENNISSLHEKCLKIPNQIPILGIFYDNSLALNELYIIINYLHGY